MPHQVSGGEWQRAAFAQALARKPDVLALSIPVSDLHIHTKLGKDREWVIATVQRSVEQARKLGLKKIALGLEDATRADPNFVREVLCQAEKCRAERVEVSEDSDDGLTKSRHPRMFLSGI